MLILLDFTDEVPIYQQIRNQIVMGIADGRLVPGEKLPTIRSLANESGINMMTVNKAYSLLKQEGYIQTDRRSGVVVSGTIKKSGIISDKSIQSLKLLISEAKLNGVSEQGFLTLCSQIYNEAKEVKECQQQQR